MTKKSIKFAHNPLFSGPSIQARSIQPSPAFTDGPFKQISITELELDPEQPRRVYDEKH